MSEIMDESFVVALATTIFLLAIYIYTPVARIVGKSLDDRTKLIEDELNQAMRLREEAQELLVSIQRKQRDASEEAESIIAEARNTADLMTSKAKSDLEAALNNRIEIAMEKIGQSEATALLDLRESIVDIAVNAARALIKDNMTKSHMSKMVDDTVTNISKKLH